LKADPGYLHLGLIGYPLGHSLSPQLHHAALRAMGLAGEYRLYPIPPMPEGQAALADYAGRLRRGELHGSNVTIPHKLNVLLLLDDLTPLAQRAGSANTLYLRDGRLTGDTTDIPGLLADLEGWLPGTRSGGGRTALILGAGGSARASAVALQSAGWRLNIAARRPEQAEALASSLGGEIATLPLESAALAGCAVELIVNSTPAGMFPKVEGCPWPEELPLPAGCAVYDLIYNPSETVLLRRARAAGLPARNGLGMLVEQAALSLERWSGLPVPREAMWGAVRN
jgi:shikimate dehydrogenase